VAADHRREQDRPVAGQGATAAVSCPPGRRRRIRGDRSGQRHARRPARSLLAETRKHLPNDELLFAEDEITDRSERFLAAEYIREKLFRLIGDELPYAAAVEIEKFVVDGGLRRISAAILVDREGHKSIVIGRGGEIIKRIASEARQDMERMFDGRSSWKSSSRSSRAGPTMSECSRRLATNRRWIR
jgi:hypothetical protein